MNEIRFNSPSAPVEAAPQSPSEPKAESPVKESLVREHPKRKILSPMIKKVFKIIALVVVVGVLVAVLVPIFKTTIAPKIFGSAKKQYAAVFLTNGQVYFGQMRSTSKSEIILENVYYLQANQNGTAASNQTLGSAFQLVKLGNELHGPTDELYINRNQVVFYEFLRDDSKVVESITKQ
jgi:hypothetical protein